jgi:hypothetical protein
MGNSSKHLTDRDHNRVKRIHRSRGNRLKRSDNVSSHDDRIDAKVGVSGMGALSDNMHHKLACSSQQWTIPCGHVAYFSSWIAVKAEDNIRWLPDNLSLEGALLAKSLSARSALLGWLKYKENIVWPMRLQLKDFGGRHEDGRVPIMAAGMHHPGMHGLVR